MKINNFMLIIQIIISVILITLILIQAKGTGLGSAWGGGGEFYRSKRGVEKTVFISTIIFTLIFLVLSLVNLIV